jgi:cytochrome c biogenesis protein CcmG/thiol:disulfide interchange protein DsbE
MIRYVAPVVVVAIMVGIFTVALNNDPTALPSPYIGKHAPNFDLPQLKDQTQRISNADLEGKAVLLNVWATWCVGCRQEHAFLLQLAREKVLPIYGLNWRNRREDALQWLAQLGDPYIASGYDSDGRAGIDWGVYGAPETFLVAADGTVLYKYLGPLGPDAWEREFVPRLRAIDGGPK